MLTFLGLIGLIVLVLLAIGACAGLREAADIVNRARHMTDGEYRDDMAARNDAARHEAEGDNWQQPLQG